VKSRGTRRLTLYALEPVRPVGGVLRTRRAYPPGSSKRNLWSSN